MSPEICFFSEDISFRIPHPRKTTFWIKKVINLEGARLDTLNYIFCSDVFLYNLNVKYLNHRTFTDIITFDLSEEPNKVSGEIYISIERIRDNSKKLGIKFPDELDRVIIHGVLHLIGYRDKSREDKKQMREKEDSYLSLRRN
ncbi:MAG TPA: rRNA maturation RNase YbeY [Cyclobacteriaceae bacterium]|nr:rRNA maturation RNase YbeY [Cyclobacteriaceae bacterium]